MSRRRISVQVARDLLWGAGEAPGLIEETVGFSPATGQLKAVHFMNDLAQTVLGGCPEGRGDLLCMVIREGVGREGEDNSEAALRADQQFGAVFSRAYPVALGAAQVRRLRLGARALLNVDQGMYAPKTQMASSVATHGALLGADGFRRFRMGAYLANILDDDAKTRLRRLYDSDSDPVSFALKPLFQPGALQADGTARIGWASPTPFDFDLGEALARVVQQPLSKPTVLRALALGSCLGFVLKVFGAGRPHGRPVLLALSGDDEARPGPLREKAVISMRRGGADLDRKLAQQVAAAAGAKSLWREPKSAEPTVEVDLRAPAEMALDMIQRLREFRSAEDDDVKRMYWPQDAVTSLGRKAGIILPRSARAGWGMYLALTPELVEVVSLMLLPWGQRMEWRAFWAEARARLGIIIGANDDEDMNALEASGVLNVSLEDLSQNAERILAHAVRRGVARRLPDSGAEIGGYEE
jgi:hypothetical protein